MDRQDLTRRIAYQLFEHRGGAHGRHLDDWFLAEAVLGLLEPAAVVPVAPKAKPRPALGERALARPERERAALSLLAEAVAREGRAAVAARLGWSSTSPVGALLRGDRPLDAELAARIEAAWGGEAQDRRAA